MDLVDECHFELGSECVDRVRMVKDEKEQQLMIEASKINDLVVDEVINICAKGNLTEKEVSDQLAGIYQKHGCTGNSFEPIVAYGKNGADNHHSGDDSTLKQVHKPLFVLVKLLYKKQFLSYLNNILYINHQYQ